MKKELANSRCYLLGILAKIRRIFVLSINKEASLNFQTTKIAFLIGCLAFCIFAHAQITTNSQWTWMKGDRIVDQFGVYGVQGIASKANKPGPRQNSVSWRDVTGNLWLFGGYGFASSSDGSLNDLWRYDPFANQWTWMKGDSTPGSIGVYGAEGIAALANKPSGRYKSVSWTDLAGNFWLFGGYESTESAAAYLNDLWRYNPKSNEWTFMKGDNMKAVYGVYGTKGIAADANKPGSREGSISWTDLSGNLWLFGGRGLATSNVFIDVLNDLWKYNPSVNQWTWMSGDSTEAAYPVFGSKGIAADANKPGSREGSISWTDLSGNLWLFGGRGYTSNAGGTYLSDLWKYDVLTNQWTWVGGSNKVDSRSDVNGVYGTRGVSAQGNIPGSRWESVSWTDHFGNFWLFGGQGFAVDTTGYLNDLWKYNPVNDQWTWMKGDSVINQNGVYGIQGITAPANRPGARSRGVSWTDRFGNSWLFGGSSSDFSIVSGFNDLWKLSKAYTFTGNGDWTTPSNWLDNLVPPNTISGDIAVIIDPVAGGQCTYNGDITIQIGGTLTVKSGVLNIAGSLSNAGTLDGPGTVRFSGGSPKALSSSGILTTPIAISNRQLFLASNTTTRSITLSNKASIRLDSFHLNIGSDSLIGADSANFIITNNTGTLIRTVGDSATLFPVGISKESYTPATIVSHNRGNDSFRVRVGAGVYTTADTSGTQIIGGTVNRTWFVTNDVLEKSNVKLALQWNAAEEQPGFDRSRSAIAHLKRCPPPRNCVDVYPDSRTRTAASGTGPFTLVRDSVASFDSPAFFVSSTSPPTLAVSTTDIYYPFAAAGSDAVKTFQFTGNNLVDVVSLRASVNFELSKDGASFASSVSFTLAEANNRSTPVYVRFKPEQNNRIYTGAVRIRTSGLADTVHLKGSSIDTSTTLEVVNWNIGPFGRQSEGTEEDTLQVQNVKTILQAINADLFALTGVVSEQDLANIVDKMPGYAYVISHYGSNTNTAVNAPSALAAAQKLAFVYDSSVIRIRSAVPLLSQGINTAADLMNPAYDYWAGGRFPFFMDAEVTLGCLTQNIKFVLVQAEVDTSLVSASYTKRKRGADTLKHTLDRLFPNGNIVILGNFGDDLDHTVTTGFTTSSWQTFINDSGRYMAITLPFSLAGKRSKTNSDDVFDHVVISNTMHPYHLDSSAAILTDVSDLVNEYGFTTANQFPVLTRYRFPDTIPPSITSCPDTILLCAAIDSLYTIPAFSASDDCKDLDFSFIISGATVRSGETNDASGHFSMGASIIDWKVTDGSGNTATCKTTVIVRPQPDVKINAPTRCANDTAALITASPSIGPYNYEWSVPAGAFKPGNVASFAATIAGTYSVVITDSIAGCTGKGTAILTVYTNPTVVVDSLTKCAAAPAVTIRARPTPEGDYKYAWVVVPAGVDDPGNVAGFTTMLAGIYSVVVTNPHTGCAGKGTGILEVNPNPAVTIPDAFALDTGALPNTVYVGYAPASSITLRAIISGGGPVNTYLWSTGVRLSSITVNPVTGRDYQLTVTNADGCATFVIKTIKVVDLRGTNFSGNVLLCHKLNSQMNTLEVSQNTVSAHLSHGDLLGRCNATTSPAELVVTAFPNPSSGSFIIMLEGGNVLEKIGMKVMNTTGRVIQQADNLFTNHSFRIGDRYLPGVYFLQVMQGGRRITIKLLKNGH